MNDDDCPLNLGCLTGRCLYKTPQNIPRQVYSTSCVLKKCWNLVFGLVEMQEC